MYHFLVWHLLQPFTLLWLFLGLALANLWRRRADTRRRLLLLTVPYVLATLVSLPIIGDLALHALESQYHPLRERPPQTEAIVVLASYVNMPVEQGIRPEMDEDCLDRCLKAAEMYHQGLPISVIVTGGNSGEDAPNPIPAESMAQFLRQLGVKPYDLIVERHSRTTLENAEESKRILDQRGLKRILLVTTAAHMPRSVGCFHKRGFEVVACPCRYRSEEFDLRLFRFLPDFYAVENFQRASHEWLGLLWYHFKEKM
jgi:uncharacterized SAM-binding protein YcdF (DUF218 family)